MISQLVKWLDAFEQAEELVGQVVPADHPVRAWLMEADEFDAPRLVEVLANGGHLSLLSALVHRACAKGHTPPPADALLELAAELVRFDATLLSSRAARSSATAFDLFVSYAHEDASVVALLVEMLREAGLTVFRDVDELRPGVSIAGSIATAVETARCALVVVSAAYVESRWAQAELVTILRRDLAVPGRLFPVVIEDVAIPATLRDHSAIDLRDFRRATHLDWARPRLEPLIEACIASRRGA